MGEYIPLYGLYVMILTFTRHLKHLPLFFCDGFSTFAVVSLAVVVVLVLVVDVSVITGLGVLPAFGEEEDVFGCPRSSARMEGGRGCFRNNRVVSGCLILSMLKLFRSGEEGGLNSAERSFGEVDRLPIIVENERNPIHVRQIYRL